MGHVFISYSRTDRQYAAKLAELLEQERIAVWLDDRIEAGRHFDKEIEVALDQAQKVVVIWSTASVESHWVRAEAGEGLKRGILVPIARDIAKIPLEFRRVQALDFSRWSGDSGAAEFRDLVRSLQLGQQSAPPAARTQANPDPVIRAEIVSVDRWHRNARIRLHVGHRTHRLDHRGLLGLRQTIKLDGKVIGEGGSPFNLEDYFRFEQVTAEIDVLELLVNGNVFRGIDHLSLRVNGQTVVDQAVPPSRGVGVMITVGIMIFILSTVASAGLKAIGVSAPVRLAITIGLPIAAFMLWLPVSRWIRRS